jgi:Leucine-rich repeat (LRR) protein
MKNIIIIILILILISLGIYYALRIETNDISSTTSTAPTDVINTKLDLSNKELTEVPIYVFDEEQLIELNLSFNQLGGSIPSEINSLTKLERLDLSNNKMTGVPAQVGQLTKLKYLDLSNNLLTGLPYELGDLQNLEYLNISGNDYSQEDLDIILEKLPESTEVIK